MRRMILILLILLSGVWTVRANDNLPWPMPQLPVLQSPTPNRVDVYGTDPESTEEPVPTNTPDPTLTLPIGDILSPLEYAQNMATLMPEITPDIEWLDHGSVSDSASELFGLVKGVAANGANSFGPFQPLISLSFFMVSMVLGMALLRLLVPLVAMVIGIIRKVVKFVLDLIPLW